MQPQAVFDLEFFSKYSTLLSALSGAPQRFGYDLNARWRRMNITHRVEYQHGRHVVDIFLHLLPKQNAQSKPISIDVVKPSAGEHSTLRSLLTADGINGRRLVAVNINAGTTSLDRRWSPQRFAEVLSAYLERRPETAVILTGDATERRYVQTMLHAHPTLGGKTFNYAGRLSLGEFLALMERVAWLLTNDSAPMHFAASMGTPVVALFGPESPAMYAPLGRGRTLYAGLPCSPCLSVYRAKQFSCPYDTLCMRSLSTTSVLEAIGQVEQETGERSACA